MMIIIVHPPEPPPINSQTEKIITRKDIVECRDQLTTRKDNYAYFVTTNGNPRDNGSKTLEKRETKKRKLLPFCTSN